jgi:hypothetical protein
MSRRRRRRKKALNTTDSKKTDDQDKVNKIENQETVEAKEAVKEQPKPKPKPKAKPKQRAKKRRAKPLFQVCFKDENGHVLIATVPFDNVYDFNSNYKENLEYIVSDITESGGVWVDMRFATDTALANQNAHCETMNASSRTFETGVGTEIVCPVINPESSSATHYPVAGTVQFVSDDPDKRIIPLNKIQYYKPLPKTAEEPKEPKESKESKESKEPKESKENNDENSKKEYNEAETVEVIEETK